MKKIVQLFGTLLPFLGVSAFAQLAGVSANYNDHPLFDRFPDSEIISVEFDEDVNYRLVLSSLQRTRGLVTPESSERLRGDVTKII